MVIERPRTKVRFPRTDRTVPGSTAPDGLRRAQSSRTDTDIDRLAEAVIGAAAEVHRTLGPRLREPVYEEALCVELGLRGIPFERRPEASVKQPALSSAPLECAVLKDGPAFEYKGRRLAAGGSDLVVGNSLVVQVGELDPEEPSRPVHIAEVLSRLSATGFRPRLALDFRAPHVCHREHSLQDRALQRCASRCRPVGGRLLEK